MSSQEIIEYTKGYSVGDIKMPDRYLKYLVRTDEKVFDFKPIYIGYLEKEVQSMVHLASRIETLTIDRENRKIIIKPYENMILPAKLQHHIRWFAKKLYNVEN